MKAAALALTVVLAGAGCVPWPHTRVHAPAREGRVVAADDRMAVEGAVVTSLATGERRVTGEDGRFEFPEAKGWHWGMVVSPPLTYSIWPFLDKARDRQRVRVEAEGFVAYDEENGRGEREVAYRSLGRGRSEDGRWWCPVETQRLEVARYIPTMGLTGTYSWEDLRKGASSPEGMLARGVGADGMVLLVREGTVPKPFSLCFDLEEDGWESPRRVKARVLDWGNDAPVCVKLAVQEGESWRQLETIWVGAPLTLWQITVTLGKTGLPERFEMRENGYDGEGLSARVAAWETFGLDGVGADVWRGLAGRDRRIEVRGGKER